MEDRKRRFGTRAVHAGQRPDPTTGAVMTPVYQTSTYAQQSPGVFVDRYDYARGANPTRTALEANLASLEGAAHAVCFASGCAAVSAAVHLLQTGDHVVLCDDVYGGTFRLFDRVFGPLGIRFTMVDMSDLEATSRAFTPRTRMVFVESPTNPLMKVVDLGALAALGRQRGALVVVDNTFATPYLQRPFEHGADLVVHSTTKYLGGHSDLIGGVLVANDDDLAERLRFVQLSVGAVPGPWECFLLLRSTKTLHLRMERHCANARHVAAHLQEHPAVERVLYPGLPSHPQHDLARRQMRDFGGMLSAVVKGGLEGAKRFLERARVFTLAESLGGVESLLDHPAIMTHASVPPEQRERLGITDGLVRLSVGVEDVEDLLEDLDQALA